MGLSLVVPDLAKLNCCQYNVPESDTGRQRDGDKGVLVGGMQPAAADIERNVGRRHDGVAAAAEPVATPAAPKPSLAELQKAAAEAEVSRRALERARSLVDLGAVARAEFQRRADEVASILRAAGVAVEIERLEMEPTLASAWVTASIDYGACGVWTVVIGSQVR
mgnify:CR=1 FL=1